MSGSVKCARNIRQTSLPLKVYCSHCLYQRPFGADISLDFIEGLPKSRGKDTILVVVDRLSKYAHFLPLSHPFSTVTVAQLYFDNIFNLHGIRKTMVSDRGKVFINQFWQELFRLHHTALHLFTAYHPQSDG